MFTPRLNKLIREPLWFAMLAAGFAGAFVGYELTQIHLGESVPAAFGKAWRGDAYQTRTILVTLLSLMVTVLTIVLSLNAPVVQSAANQYSPRLVPIYIKNTPVRGTLPLFVFTGTYILSAIRYLGLVESTNTEPRPVVSGAFVLMFLSLGFLIVAMFRTFRFMRVELVLGLVQDAIFEAAARLRARTAGLELDPRARLSQPIDAFALTAPASGYIIDIELRKLAKRARRARVRVRVSRTVGDHVDRGETVGWIASDSGKRVTQRLARHLAGALHVAGSRERYNDPGLGIRMLVDVAVRALSSSSNDGFTARQALEQLRSVLRHLAKFPLGDWNVIEPDGKVRVSVLGVELRELLSLAVDAPLRWGAEDPDVIEAVLAIALEVTCTAKNDEDRAAAYDLLDNVLEVAEHTELTRARAKSLHEQAELIRRSLRGEILPSERLVRSRFVILRTDQYPLGRPI